MPADHMPEVVGLCPDPACTKEFYMPHGGPCPMECDETLVECRRVEVTDEMVERAARWVFAHRQQEDKLVRCGLIGAQKWEDVPDGCWAHEDARETARGVLAAALEGGETHGD